MFETIGFLYDYDTPLAHGERLHYSPFGVKQGE